MHTIMKVYASNKRARHDYEIEYTLTAGIVLAGHEVKSVRNGHASLKGSYVIIKDGEAWLLNAHITKYSNASLEQHDPTATRKLLLKKSEIKKINEAKTAGRSAIPLAIGAAGNYIKLSIGIGRGKKKYDKRQSIKKRDQEQSMKKIMKTNR